MARIRSDILYKRKVKEVEENQRQARRFHITPLALSNQENSDSDDEENESVCEDDLNVSDWKDNSDNENNTDSDEEDNDFHWSEICANWIDLANRKDQFDNEEDNHLLEMAQNFHAGIIIFI